MGEPGQGFLLCFTHIYEFIIYQTKQPALYCVSLNNWLERACSEGWDYCGDITQPVIPANILLLVMPRDLWVIPRASGPFDEPKRSIHYGLLAMPLQGFVSAPVIVWVGNFITGKPSKAA